MIAKACKASWFGLGFVAEAASRSGNRVIFACSDGEALGLLKQ